MLEAMSRVDRLREEIGLMKVICALGAGIDASLVAWLVQKYETMSPLLIGLAGCFAGMLFCIIVAAGWNAYRCLELLEVS